MFSTNYIQVAEAGCRDCIYLRLSNSALPHSVRGSRARGETGTRRELNNLSRVSSSFFFCFRKSSTVLSQSGFYITRPCTNLDVNVRAIEAMGATT